MTEERKKLIEELIRLTDVFNATINIVNGTGYSAMDDDRKKQFFVIFDEEYKTNEDLKIAIDFSLKEIKKILKNNETFCVNMKLLINSIDGRNNYIYGDTSKKFTNKEKKLLKEKIIDDLIKKSVSPFLFIELQNWLRHEAMTSKFLKDIKNE